jgi:hypothetical protein
VKPEAANKLEDAREKAVAYHDMVWSISSDRYHVAKLELIVDNQCGHAKYRNCYSYLSLTLQSNFHIIE